MLRHLFYFMITINAVLKVVNSEVIDIKMNGIFNTFNI
jgi:hypothetical protein